MSRKTNLTQEVKQKIVDAIKQGNYRETAARFAGISVRSFYEWMKRGNAEESGIYRELRDAVIEAEQEAEVLAVQTITSSKDPKHLQWWLERKFPARWGKLSDFMKKLQQDLAELKAMIEEKE